MSLIVVDEEHEQSYKQQDPSPRYHARDTAMVLASMSGAHVVLGSATPSVESYHNALQGKYSLVSLPHRYADVAMPEINVVNIKEAYAAGKMKGHFSHELIERTKEAIGSGRQVILFQNRRGYAPVVECRDCGWTPQCRHCRCKPYIPQTLRQHALPLLRVQRTSPATMPAMRFGTARHQRFRHGTSRSRSRKTIPRCPHIAYGPGYYGREKFIPEHHNGF